jgi:hypothetical protein
MKSKITLLLMMVLSVTSFMGNYAFAQTASGVASNTGCLNSGIVTASSTGLGATPQYQLLKNGTPEAPVVGDPSQFTNTTTFNGLQSGTYTVKARAFSGGTIYTSSNITVIDGYTTMSVITPTKVLSCLGGFTTLTPTVTGGKTPFTYTIATQSAPSTIIESSGSIATNNFTFASLPTNNYIVSVTDACGQTVTGATSISNPTVTIADIKVWSISYLNYDGGVGNCSTALRMVNEGGWAYTTGGASVSTADAALFTWKIKYQGVLYGLDDTGDGYADATGAGIPLANTSYRMPLIATRAGIIADYANMRIVVSDTCGNTKEFLIRNYNATSSRIGSGGNCNGSPIINAFLGAGMACLPVNVTFTNASNPTDVVTFNITSGNQTFIGTGLTPGQTYNLSYLDSAGFTGNTVYSTAALNISTASTFSASQYAINVNQYYLAGLNYARAYLVVNPALPTDMLTYTVTASNNPLVPIGYTNSQIYGNNPGGINLLKVNASDPTGFWPKGIYTLAVSGPCGVSSVTLNIGGYTSSLSASTITPVCGGFNYVMNGTFDVASAYQVIIVSGPSAVGQVRDLASTSSSLPFNGLAYGTYVFGLRIKGGTTNVLTQTVTYGASNVINVDTTNTGGYVCSAGATNGTLTIAAITNSPAPGNTLEYAISLDGGATYGAYQTANTFSGLGSGTYFFKVKDGCGNIITQSAQIGVAASPVVSVNGVPGNTTLCEALSGETVMLTLDVNIPDAIYSWTLGNGITPSNSNIKNPVISVSDMSVGVNNYSCTITLGAPCNTTSVGNVEITILANPIMVVTNPVAVCNGTTVDITASAITAGSDAGLTYTYFTDVAATIPLPNPTAISVGGTYYIKGTNPGTSCFEIQPVTVTIDTCTCTKTPATGTPAQYTKMGITVQQKQTAWPENIPNGFIALESKEKGLVITRVQNQSQIADPKAGMIIYDIDANCVKLFNGTIWNCIKKSCND